MLATIHATNSDITSLRQEKSISRTGIESLKCTTQVLDSDRGATRTFRNAYKLPVELNALILYEAAGSSLHDYFISERCMFSGTDSELEQDDWARNSFFILSSVSYSFREMIKRAVKNTFNIDASYLG